jgi:ribosomal protein S10
MKICNATFFSKNKNSLNSAFLFFLNVSYLNFKIVKKYFQKKTKKSFITILKSPHVNKKAQEQFETRFYSKQLSIYSTKKLKYVFFFKKIQNNVFSDVKLKLKFTTSFCKKKKLYLSLFEPKNYVVVRLDKNLIDKKTSLNDKRKLIHFNSSLSSNILKIFDIYGEFHIAN